jgi:hypothetical protein
MFYGEQSMISIKDHHRKSIRLESYDYSLPGVYFVTLACHQRKTCSVKWLMEKFSSLILVI